LNNDEISIRQFVFDDRVDILLASLTIQLWMLLVLM